MDVLNLLDYGYVKLVESWGSDERIIEAARMSTGKGFLGWGPMCKECSAKGLDSPVELDGTSCERCGNTLQHGDEKLLAYLWNNAHHTPFEMAGLSIEVQAPIFVFREWHRHRVPFSYNEASARYAPLPAIDYIPSIECATRVDAGSKQSAAVAGAPVFTVDDASEMRRDFADHFARTEALYQKWLSRGARKEHARIPLTVGRYSKMRASANLRGWLNFITLRAAPNAQFEIQEYARAVHTILGGLFPRTIELFNASRTK